MKIESFLENVQFDAKRCNPPPEVGATRKGPATRYGRPGLQLLHKRRAYSSSSAASSSPPPPRREPRSADSLSSPPPPDDEPPPSPSASTMDVPVIRPGSGTSVAPESARRSASSRSSTDARPISTSCSVIERGSGLTSSYSPDSSFN